MKHLVPLLLVFIGSILFILCLNYLSAEDQEYNFVRTPHQLVLDPEAFWDIHTNTYYVAGKVSDKIYLGNNSAPKKILILETGLPDSIKEDSIRVPNALRKASHIMVDSNAFTVLDLISYHIYRGSTDDWKANAFMTDGAFFAEAAPVNNNTFIFRTFSDTVREYVLAKKTKFPSSMERKSGLLEKQIDGLFCTDGMLHYNRQNNQIIYVYFYRNQFLCMDTSLNLRYRGNSIDPIKKARIKVARLKEDGSTTLASPPYLVNKRSHTWGEWLFIYSNIKAKNEEWDFFKETSAIDVYSLNTGSYSYSFYIPEFRGYKVKEFKVFDSTLVAIQGHYLVTYTLPNPFKE